MLIGDEGVGELVEGDAGDEGADDGSEQDEGGEGVDIQEVEIDEDHPVRIYDSTERPFDRRRYNRCAPATEGA